MCENFIVDFHHKNSSINSEIFVIHGTVWMRVCEYLQNVRVNIAWMYVCEYWVNIVWMYVWTHVWMLNSVRACICVGTLAKDMHHEYMLDFVKASMSAEI